MTLKKALLAAYGASLLLNIASYSTAQTLQRIAQPNDQTFDNQTTSYSLDLSQFLDVPGVSGQIVILESDLGNIPFEMLAGDAPLTVTNFLSYVDDKSYDNSIIHRAVPNFIMQGGGYTSEIPLGRVPSKPPVINEFKLPNIRGTVAMAKIGGDPNSATNGWFVNTNDNRANLDSQNGGFTVFARVIGNGMTVVDTIMELPKIDVFGSFLEPQVTFPLEPSNSGQVTVDDLVTIQQVYQADLFPTSNTSPSFVSYSEVSSSNAAVATASLDDIDVNQLTLTLGEGETGSSDITVTASDANGNTVELTFTVTLEEAYVTLEKASQELDYQEANYNLALDSNTTWQAENVPSWVTLSSSSGDGPEQLTVTVSANEGSTPRSATVTINGQSHTIRQRNDFNGWLATYFTANEISAMSPSAYAADSDSDGLSNLVENTLGLDPSDRNSRIRSQIDFDGSAYTLSYTPYSEVASFGLEISDNLEVWAPLEATPTVVEDSIRFEISADNVSQNFYQLRVESAFFTTPES